METGNLDQISGDDLEILSSYYHQILDDNFIRYRDDVPEINFPDDSVRDNILQECAKICPRRRRRSSRRISEKSPEKQISEDTVFVETAKLPDSVKTVKKKPKKRLDLDPEKAPVSPRGWADGGIENHFSLKDIMEEESKINPKKENSKKLNFTPVRRKQAKGQDIIRREKEMVIELAKSPSTSPWGKARPVKEQFFCLTLFFRVRTSGQNLTPPLDFLKRRASYHFNLEICEHSIFLLFTKLSFKSILEFRNLKIVTIK